MQSLIHLLFFIVMVYILVMASIKLKEFGLGFLILGLFALWRTFNSFVFPFIFKLDNFEDYEVLKTDGFVCRMKSKDGKVGKSGCMYKDVGCISPEPEGGCPPTFEEYRSKLNLKNEGCDKSILFRKLKKLDDNQLNLYIGGKGELQIEYPVEDCLTGIDESADKKDIFKTHYREFLNSQKANGSQTEVPDYSKTINTEYRTIMNDMMKEVYREVYKPFFNNTLDNSVNTLEKTRLDATKKPGVTPLPKTTVPSGSFVPEKNGYVIIAKDKQKPEIFDLKEAAKIKDGQVIKTKGLEKQKRQDLINKCNKYICNKRPEHVQAYTELGEKVEDLDWWNSTNSSR